MKISRIPLASLRRISTTLIVIAATSLFAVAQTENVLYRFKGGADSGLPDAGLIRGGKFLRHNERVSPWMRNRI